MISCYIGPNGAGKTLSAIEEKVQAQLKAGRQVLSNVAISHPGVTLWTKMSQLLELRGGMFFADEVNALFPSRSWESMPLQIVTRLQSLRHYDVDGCWTAPSFERADVVLREVTFEVNVCRGLLSRGGVGWKGARLVATQRLSRDEFLARKWRSLSFGTRVRRPGKTWAGRHYDTAAPVGLIDLQVVQAGACLYCGGFRKKPVCNCGNREDQGRGAA